MRSIISKPTSILFDRTCSPFTRCNNNLAIFLPRPIRSMRTVVSVGITEDARGRSSKPAIAMRPGPTLSRTISERKAGPYASPRSSAAEQSPRRLTADAMARIFPAPWTPAGRLDKGWRRYPDWLVPDALLLRICVVHEPGRLVVVRHEVRAKTRVPSLDPDRIYQAGLSWEGRTSI